VIEVFDTLVRIPGVKQVVLTTVDGVPIVVRGTINYERPINDADRQTNREAEEGAQALAGHAIGWMADLARAIGPLSLDSPRHVVVRATRGTLVAHCAYNAVLLVLLERGTRPEDLRLPMEGTVGRLHRVLRSFGYAVDETASTPPGALPAQPFGRVHPGLVGSSDIISIDLSSKRATDLHEKG
jgi:hypothetical protein